MEKIITQLDENTKVIFRMDVGDNSHPINSHGYKNPVDHINIEIQVKNQNGDYKRKWDFHMILDDIGSVVDYFVTGPWKNK